jgi:acylphosphatase
MELKVYKYIIEGKVQGVGYRFFAYRKANEFDIKGYAKNLMNGNVEVIAVGTEANLQKYLAELKKGPMRAYVSTIIVEEYESDEIFNIFKMY